MSGGHSIPDNPPTPPSLWALEHYLRKQSKAGGHWGATAVMYNMPCWAFSPRKAFIGLRYPQNCLALVCL